MAVKDGEEVDRLLQPVILIFGGFEAREEAYKHSGPIVAVCGGGEEAVVVVPEEAVAVDGKYGAVAVDGKYGAVTVGVHSVCDV